MVVVQPFLRLQSFSILTCEFDVVDGNPVIISDYFDCSFDKLMQLQPAELSFCCVLMHFLPGWQNSPQEELFFLHGHLYEAHLLRHLQLRVPMKCSIVMIMMYC